MRASANVEEAPPHIMNQIASNIGYYGTFLVMGLVVFQTARTIFRKLNNDK